ncbi:MAG: hypothetical protein Q9217_003406 [Psora testacea]
MRDFWAAYFKATLGGVRDIHQAGEVWSDGKPDNILFSDIDGPAPVIKLSDLGLFRAQALAWTTDGVLGAHDNKYREVWGDLFDDSWCMTKIIDMLKLYESTGNKMPGPPSKEEWKQGSTSHEAREASYNLAYRMFSVRDTGDERSLHVPKCHLEEVLEKQGFPETVKAMFRLCFVVNHEVRSTARVALSSTVFKRLLELRNQGLQMQELEDQLSGPTVPRRSPRLSLRWLEG